MLAGATVAMLAAARPSPRRRRGPRSTSARRGGRGARRVLGPSRLPHRPHRWLDVPWRSPAVRGARRRRGRRRPPGPPRAAGGRPVAPAVALDRDDLLRCYLWHWPIDVFADTARTGLAGAPLQLARLAYLAAQRPVLPRRAAGPGMAAGLQPLDSSPTRRPRPVVAGALVVAPSGRRHPPAPPVPLAIAPVTGPAAVDGAGGFGDQVARASRPRPGAQPGGPAADHGDRRQLPFVSSCHRGRLRLDRRDHSDRPELPGWACPTTRPTLWRPRRPWSPPTIRHRDRQPWSWDDTARSRPPSYRATLEEALRELLASGDGVSGFYCSSTRGWLARTRGDGAEALAPRSRTQRQRRRGRRWPLDGLGLPWARHVPAGRVLDSRTAVSPRGSPGRRPRRPRPTGCGCGASTMSTPAPARCGRATRRRSSPTSSCSRRPRVLERLDSGSWSADPVFLAR